MSTSPLQTHGIGTDSEILCHTVQEAGAMSNCY